MSATNQLKHESGRSYSLDFIRALAIVLMVVYHFNFDLFVFGVHDINPNNHVEWRAFRYLIMTLFLVCVGISIVLSHTPHIRVKKLIRRLIILGLASIVVSIGSYTQFPNSWIYFGILHFILIGSVVALLFRNNPNVALSVALIILLLYNADWIGVHGLFEWVQPWLGLPYRSEDSVPLIPWISAVLIGIYVGHYRLYVFTQNEQYSQRIIAFMSKYSLWIYLIHQPILIGLLALFV